MTMNKIHPSAVIHPEAQLDPSVEVGPFCVIGKNVKVGKNTKLMSHVILDGWTEIGEENTIFPGASLGAIPQDLKYKGEKTHLVIGDRNIIRECVTMNLGTVQGGGLTKVGNDNMIMAYAHIGHDCIVHNHVILVNYVGLGGHCVIEDWATLLGMTGAGQYLRVGAHAYVGGQSALEKDIPPFSIAVGSRPCRLKGANIVGLRRRGIPADRITKINEAIKLWTREDVMKEQALLEIDSQFGELEEIQYFINFIKKSECGVAR
jgi:UDP-N-acetylglucosamine acyltransferase